MLLLAGMLENVNSCFSAPYVDIRSCCPFFSLFCSSPLLFCLSFGNCGLVFDPPVSSTVTEEIYEMMRDIFAVSVFQ